MPPNQPTQLHSFEENLQIDLQAALQTLQEAAKTFVKDIDSTIQIWAASRDWFLEEWGRDTFIALPGLLLATDHNEEAKNNIRNFAKYEKNGLIPNRIESPDKILYNSVDAPMWFIQAIKSLNDGEFTQEMLPVIKKIIHGYQNGTTYQHHDSNHQIKMDPKDGLIISPAQATWMDADPSTNGTAIVTPRNGKAVEVNALWYSNLRFLAQHETDFNALTDQVKDSFNKKFWNKDESCLFDVIEGDPHSAAVRPNMLIAISHGADLLTFERQEATVNRATEDLLTPGGLRTLSPRDSNYIGQYNTAAPMAEKDKAYHQGTVWPWLMGPYLDALSIVHPDQEIAPLIAPLLQFCLDSPHKSLPEVFSGDAPHEPGGTTSQAWSVSEILRILTKLLKS